MLLGRVSKWSLLLVQGDATSFTYLPFFSNQIVREAGSLPFILSDGGFDRALIDQ